MCVCTFVSVCLIIFCACALEEFLDFLPRSLHDEHKLRWKVPNDGEMEKHIRYGDHILEEGEPTKGQIMTVETMLGEEYQ